MDKTELLYVFILIGGFIFATIPTMLLWNGIKKKLDKTPKGRHLLDVKGIHGGRFIFLIHCLCWIVLMIFITLIFILLGWI